MKLDKNIIDDIDQSVKEAFGNESWDIKDGDFNGASATTLSISCKNKSFIVRLSDKSRPVANIPLEYHCMQQASEYKVTPNVHFMDVERGICIMDQVENQIPDFSNGMDRKNILDLASVISNLHSGAIFPPSYSCFDLIMSVGNGLKDTFFEDKYLSQCLSIVERIRPLVDVEEDKRPSHRDLHGFNALFSDRRCYLIDWETAGNDTFYFDLAQACNTMLYQREEDSRTLLKAYFNEEISNEQKAKFELTKIVAFIHYGIVLTYMSTSLGEKRLSDTEIEALASYSSFMDDYYSSSDRDMTGKYLPLGYVNLKQALARSGMSDVKEYFTLLQRQVE